MPLALVAVKVTLYVPGLLNTTTGFWLPLVATETSGGKPPKFQAQDVGLFVEEIFKIYYTRRNSLRGT